MRWQVKGLLLNMCIFRSWKGKRRLGKVCNSHSEGNPGGRKVPPNGNCSVSSQECRNVSE